MQRTDHEETVFAPSFHVARRAFLTASAAVVGSLGSWSSARALGTKTSTIRVDLIRTITAKDSKYVEPWIAAHPRDASNLVILAVKYFGKGPYALHTEPAAWATADGGTTWSGAEFAGMAQLRGERSNFGNVHAAFAPDGTAFCVYCGHPNKSRLDLWVFRSDDQGRRWLGPTAIPGTLDYPRLTADLDGETQRVFVMAGVDGDSPVFGNAKRSGYGCIVLRSDDAAKTFSPVNFLAPTTLHHDPIDSPTILPDGRLLVGFADYPTANTVNEPQEQIEHVRIYAASSQNGGETFSKPAPIGEALPWDGYKAIAADRSNGPFRGRIYAVGHSQSPKPPGLLLQTSGDGVTWSSPIVVPGLPEGPVAYAKCAVSSRGILGLAWIQGEPDDQVRPHDAKWTSCEHAWTMYVTASADGGKTYAKPVPLFETAYRTDPTVPRWPYGAEYISLAASADGKFNLVWVDTRDGRGMIQTTRFELEM